MDFIEVEKKDLKEENHYLICYKKFPDKDSEFILWDTAEYINGLLYGPSYTYAVEDLYKIYLLPNKI